MTKGQEIVSVKSLLSRQDYQSRFKEILGARAAQFSASVVNISRDRFIAECDPASVIAAAIVAATLDLPVDRNLGFAWIVPYAGVAQFQMGYKGFIQLALRSGRYLRMNARAVNAEAFGGYDDVGEPIILWDKVDEESPRSGYAFAWRLTTGFSKTCYWSKERVEAHARQYSQAYRKGKDTPWKTHFDQMATKTVIKNELSDWGILSIELQKAMTHDQGAQIDIESEIVYPDRIGDGQAAAGVKEADTSDLGPVPTKKAPKETAKAKATAPAASPAPSEAASEPEAAPAGETASKPATTPEASKPSGTPQEQAAAEATLRQELIGEINNAMQEHELGLPEVTRFLETNSIAKKGQRIKDLSTGKLRNLTAALQNPDTIAAIKKLAP